MYAVVEDSGRQYKISPGQTIDLDRRELPRRATTVTLDRVLMLGEGADAKVGTPLVEGASVEARIEAELRGPKIDVVKIRRRKGYRRKTGHRQSLLRVTVTEITDGVNSWQIEPGTQPEPYIDTESGDQADADAEQDARPDEEQE